MTIFYSKNISNKSNQLSVDESKHCLLALRMTINDKIFITEGDGNLYSARIKNTKNQLVTYDNIKIISKKNKKIHIHIVIAPPKNKARFEWFLEKVTELGVNIISPIICDNSERKKINIKRCEKILISAMKQSENSLLPQINTPVSFDQMVQNIQKNTYIAHCYKEKKQDFKNILLNHKHPSSITLFIGPEGDFSKKELIFAIKMGLTPVKLGDSRLRTETAGVVGCSMINLLI